MATQPPGLYAKIQEHNRDAAASQTGDYWYYNHATLEVTARCPTCTTWVKTSAVEFQLGRFTSCTKPACELCRLCQRLEGVPL